MKKKLIYIFIGILVLVGIYFYSFVDRQNYVYDKQVESADYKNVPLLWPETVIEQNFYCTKNGLFSVKFKVGTYARENSNHIQYEIIDVNKNISVANGEINAKDLTDGEFCEIKFDKIEDSKGSQYKLVLRSDDAESDNGIAIFTTKASQDNTKLVIDGEENNEVLTLRTVSNGFDVETFIIMIFLFIYMCVFIKVLFWLFR